MENTQDPVTQTDAAEKKSAQEAFMPKALAYFLKYNTIMIFVLLVIISSIISDVFFTPRNLFNLLRQVAPIGIMSMGMLLVILTSGIDLSVGSVLALASVLSAYFCMIMPLSVALILTVLIGVVVGAGAGYLVSLQRMAPFIATLALMTIARGFAFIVSKGSPILLGQTGKPLKAFAREYFIFIPQPVWIMLAVFFLVFFLLKYTVFGRLVIAIGSNEDAVRLSGINAKWYKFAVYCIAGGFSAIAGIVSTSRTGVGSPLLGMGAELDVIAAVVIGGASLSGGKGTALNTLLGVCILGMIGNIMNLMNVPGYPQQVIKGVIIIFAVMLQNVQSKSR